MAPDNTVPTTGLEYLPARDVKPGMWVAFVADDYERPLVEVLFVRTDASGSLSIIVDSDGNTVQHCVTPDQPYRLGTDVEVVNAQHATNRRRIAAQFAELADLFANDNMPVPSGGDITATVRMPNVQAARTAAEVLGVELREDGRYARASWPAGVRSYEPGVHLHIDAPTPETDSDDLPQ